MQPITPVIPNHPNWPTIQFAKTQDQYLTLLGIRLDNEYKTVVSRWKLTWRERIQVLLHGSIWLHQATFGSPLTPVNLFTECLVELDDKIHG